jgi:hypothetical protein
MTLILFVLFVAAPAFAQERRSSLVLPSVVFVGAQAADLHSTHQAIRNGQGVEGNRVMAGSNANRIALKSAITVATVYAAQKIHKRHPRVAKVFLYGGAAAMFGLAAHNYRVAHR